ARPSRRRTEDRLPLPQRRPARTRPPPPRLQLLDPATGVALLVAAGEHGARVVAEVGGVVAGVEKRVFVEPDVDERRLHTGQHVRHDSLVDAPDDRALPMALEIEVGEEITLLNPDASFGEARVDDDSFAHGSTSLTRRTAPGAGA